MKIKRILSLIAAAAMALTSLTGAMTATAADEIKGTLTVAVGTLSLSGSGCYTGSVEIDGENDYTIDVSFIARFRYLDYLGYFTFSPIDGVAPCKITVNSMEISLDSAGSSKVTLIPSKSNTDLIPTANYMEEAGSGAELPSKNNVVDDVVAAQADGDYNIKWDSSASHYYLYSDKDSTTTASVYGVSYNVTVSSSAGVAAKKNNLMTISLPEGTGNRVVFGSDTQVKLEGNEGQLPVIYELSSMSDFRVLAAVTDEFTKNGNLKGYTGTGRGNFYLRARTEGTDDYFESFSNVISFIIASPSDQTELNKLKERAKTLSSNSTEGMNYTSESKAKLKEVLEEIESTITATSEQEEVDAAVEKLQAAIDALVINPASESYVNELREILAIAKTLIKTDYTAESWARGNFETYIPAAEKALAAEIPAYYDVTLPLDVMKYGINNLVPVDTTEELAALASAIEEAEGYVFEDYTFYTFFKLSEALDTAQSVPADALKSVIDNAKVALDETIAGLKKADTAKAKAALDKAIANAEGIDADNYTEESYAELTAAIEAAKAVSEDALNTEINAAAEAVKDAIAGLKAKPTEAPTTPAPVVTDPTTATAPTTWATTANNGADKKTVEKAMKQAKITKLTAKSKAKKKIVVSWKKVSKAKGYEVQVSTKKNFKKSVTKKTTSKNKLTIKKLKSKKTYFVRVRAYATYKDTNGETQKVYSSWNKKIRKVKVK